VIVEHQFDAGTRHRIAPAGTIEQHILHGLAAQVLGRGFPQHPAHRIDHIGFAATVRADHADQLAGTWIVVGSTKDLNPASFI